ncbi:acyl-CoA-binding protein [Cunninghamella echinulata]|nr:acyl-CoA-binding protein [Cunninghamella echinulata]
MPSAAFDTAANEVKTLKKSPSNDKLLKLYALFKQATVGDNTTTRPGVFDVKGKAKWDAWDAIKGTSQEEAEKQYIALVEELKAADN